MPTDRVLASDEWKELRAAALRRDRSKCTKPNCVSRGWIVQFLVPLEAGGAPVLGNVATYCGFHAKARGERDQPRPGCGVGRERWRKSGGGPHENVPTGPG